MHKFAEQILFGSRLEDKLVAFVPDFPATVLPQTPSPLLLSIPSPGRPHELRFRSSDRRPFPKPGQLDKDEIRGEVFHYFANHELLALELMALCLLRFPEATEAFRQGLLRAMQEEQSHLKSYMRRMEELGVEFGSLPANNFFWTALASMSSPLAFVTGMSLTFEQANLDFALYYSQLFAQVGDTTSSEVMKTVYEDEIGHVKFGYTWFDRWNEQKTDPWTFYQAHLPYPLTPQRAKGRNFSAASRLQAGIPQGFIESLNLYSHSKGRPARIFWFDSACESSLASGPSYCPSLAQDALGGDFDILPTFLAKADDIVLTTRPPAKEVLATWQHAGFTLPHYITVTASDQGQLQDELSKFKAQTFEPWGWSYRAAKLFSPFAHGLQKPDSSWPPLAESQIGDIRPLFSKEFGVSAARDYLESLSAPARVNVCPPWVLGEVVHSILQLNQLLANPQWQRYSFVVVKAPWGTSGQNMKRIASGVPLNPNQRGWIEHVLSTQKSVIAEPWLDRQMDVSFQFEVNAPNLANATETASDPATRLFDYTRMLTDHRGQYRGHRLGRRTDDLSEEVCQAFHAFTPFRPMIEHLKQAALLVGKRLSEAGYRGPAGIDALVYQSPEGALLLKPIVEINPRFTMGRVALGLESHISAGQGGLWLHTTRKQIMQSYGTTPEEWLLSLQKQLPTKIRTQAGGPQFIEQGVIPTVNWPHIQQFLAVLVVGTAEVVNNLTEKLIVQHRGPERED